MSLIVIIILAVVCLVVLFLAGLAIVNFSFDEMCEKFNKLSTFITNISPVELAEKVSSCYFGGKIKIVFKKGRFCDCYSSNKVLTLSSDNATSNNLAGLAICAHELGHAFQFKDQPQKMKKYGKKVRASKIMSKLFVFLLFVALFLVIFDKLLFALIGLGVALVCFIGAIGVKFSTIKIEKEASMTALKILQEDAYLSETEVEQAKQFLNSAKQTYVADLLKSMLKWTGLTKK